jgi:hypothetical protein
MKEALEAVSVAPESAQHRSNLAVYSEPTGIAFDLRAGTSEEAHELAQKLILAYLKPWRNTQSAGYWNMRIWKLQQMDLKVNHKCPETPLHWYRGGRKTEEFRAICHSHDVCMDSVKRRLFTAYTLVHVPYTDYPGGMRAYDRDMCKCDASNALNMYLFYRKMYLQEPSLWAQWCQDAARASCQTFKQEIEIITSLKGLSPIERQFLYARNLRDHLGRLEDIDPTYERWEKRYLSDLAELDSHYEAYQRKQRECRTLQTTEPSPPPERQSAEPEDGKEDDKQVLEIWFLFGSLKLGTDGNVKLKISPKVVPINPIFEYNFETGEYGSGIEIGLSLPKFLKGVKAIGPAGKALDKYVSSSFELSLMVHSERGITVGSKFDAKPKAGAWISPPEYPVQVKYESPLMTFQHMNPQR